MKSKVEIGREYRLNALRTLACLGYATTRQIAMSLVGGCEPTDRKQACRTLHWLLEQGLVVERRDSVNGERMVALTRKGVNTVRDEIDLAGYRVHARDLLRHAHKHRTMCNSVWAALYRGLVIPGYTELQIRSGDAPPGLAQFDFRMDGQHQQKIPDLLLTSVHGDRLDAPVWVEVENAYRGQQDFDKLIAFMRVIFRLPHPPISSIWFVVTAKGANSIGKRLRAALTHSPASGWPRQIKDVDALLLEGKIRLFSLDVDRLSLVSKEF